jgi:hypothetical protein
MKAKRSTRKREHSLNEKVKTRVFLAMKNRVHLLQKKYVGSNHLLQQTKQKKTESESKDVQEKCIEYEGI